MPSASTLRWQKWKQTNPFAKEKLREKYRKWRAKNKGRYKEQDARRKHQWHEQHRYERSIYFKEWRRRNPDKRRSYALRWLSLHPEESLFRVFSSIDKNPGYERHLENNQLNPFEILCLKEEQT